MSEPIKIYLAAAYSKRDQIREIAAELQSLRVQITSRYTRLGSLRLVSATSARGGRGGRNPGPGHGPNGGRAQTGHGPRPNSLEKTARLHTGAPPSARRGTVAGSNSPDAIRSAFPPDTNNPRPIPNPVPVLPVEHAPRGVVAAGRFVFRSRLDRLRRIRPQGVSPLAGLSLGRSSCPLLPGWLLAIA